MPLIFTHGQDYARSEIHARLGGSQVACLPTNEGKIVAACLSEEFSPQAPEVVLCGRGIRTGPVSALFACERDPLPVFIKRAANHWQYRGLFVVTESFSSGAEFKSFIAGSKRSVASVSHVVLLRRFA